MNEFYFIFIQKYFVGLQNKYYYATFENLLLLLSCFFILAQYRHR
jgi:hypothetical protein